MQDHYKIKTTSRTARTKLIAMLLKAGYRWHGETEWTAQEIEKTYPFRTWPLINVRRDAGELSGSSWASDSAITIAEFLRLPKASRRPANPSDKLVLNDSYSAVVSDDGVSVGCQLFSHEIIVKLGRLSAKRMKARRS